RAAERTSGHVAKVDRSAVAVSEASSHVTGLVVDTTASIEEMMAQVREIDRSAASLLGSTSGTASAIQEMGSNIAEVAQNADYLAVQVADAAIGMDQVGRSIKNVDKSGQDLISAAEATGNAIASAMDSIRLVEQSAQESERLAQIVVADAENGRARVRSTREGMEGITSAMGEVVAVITHLGESSVRINEILDLIEKVAGQTNVLALNAALIAAHAGSEGKAFGVVATKIRELSSGTGERTKDIARLIGSVRGDVSAAMAVVQRAGRAVERGTAFASEAEVALDKILGSAREASRLAQGIARATVEQLVLGEQIAKAMDRVKHLTGDIYRATEEQARVSVRLQATMESLKERAALFKRATVELRTGSVQIVGAMDNVAEHVREISRATAEQAKGGKAISAAVVEIENAARTLGGSAADQSQDSKHAVTAMAEINDIVKRNASRVQEIDRAVTVLLEESGRLVRDVSALEL
ncbi:MAG: methyl-accepting chemotaxis protein, partial [Acidobacteriota bacterium]